MPDTTWIDGFFTAFVEDFSRFNGQLIATHYSAPYVAIATTGERRILSNHAEIAQYFDGFLARYQAQGCRSCGYQDLQISSLSPTQCVVSVTWQLFDAQHQIVSTWRESYLLLQIGMDWKIVMSIDHVFLFT